ncbi:MAG: amidohydrolase family protein [Gemmatimonadales bacterium]
MRCRSQLRITGLGIALLLRWANLVAQEAPDSMVAVVGATLWDGTGSAAQPDAVVLIHDGLIVCTGTAVVCPVPAGTTPIDATGRFLLPGLIDTHVHLLFRMDGITDTSIKRDLHGLLARGITTVRDMGNNPKQLILAVEAGQPAPRVLPMQLVAGQHFFRSEVEIDQYGNRRNHSPAAMGMSQLGWWPLRFLPYSDPAEIVRQAREAGAIGLKLYQDLDSAQTAGLVTAAHTAGLTVWGHGWVQPASVLEQSQAGQDGVVHAAGLAGELVSKDARRGLRTSSSLLQVTADSATAESAQRPAVIATLDSLALHGTFLEPTLQASLLSATRAGSRQRRIPSLPDRYALAASRFGMEVTREAAQRGVRLTAGTDHTAYGPEGERAQLIDELALFVDSIGLSPARALLAATRDAATAIGPIARDIGTVAVGKRADLVLLSADPLADIGNLRSVEWVMLDGKMYRPEELRRLP